MGDVRKGVEAVARTRILIAVLLGLLLVPTSYGVNSAMDEGDEDSDLVAIAASRGEVVREGATLRITTARGVVSLADDDSDLSEDYRIHRYEGRLEGTPFHAVHLSFFESPGYLLVHETTGRTCSVDARPVASPSGRRLAVASFDLEAMMSPNVLTLLEVSGDSLLTIWTEEPDDWGPQKLAWIDDDTLELTRVFATDRGPGEYDRVRVRLAHGFSGWEWEAEPEPIEAMPR